MPRTAHETRTTTSARRAAIAAFLGSTLEYYDFYLYAVAAALIFDRLFFPSGNAAVGLALSFATFGVAYVARPVGGIVMSHFGDRIGRRRVLMITLAIMGTSSFAVGLLPTYGSVGILAPILLVTARLAQGFSAGAELAGATTLTLEHAPDRHRSFFTSWASTGCSAGLLLATLVFIPVAALPDAQMLAWGWRIPFLSSVVVFAIAYWVRTRLDEPPEFEKQQETDAVARVPGVEVLRTQPTAVLRVVLMTLMASSQTIFSFFSLSYASETAGVGKSPMLIVNAVTLGLSIAVLPLAASLSDRIGRKPTLLIGAVGSLLSLFLFFWFITTGSIVLISLGAFLFMSVLYSFWSAVYPVYFAELFATPVRYSGMAIGQQIGLVLVGFAPVIGALLQRPGPYGWLPVAAFTGVCIGIAAIAVWTGPETYDVPVDRLGRANLPADAAEPPSAGSDARTRSAASPE
ncbi:MFS transporter [Amycolatopsis halotolerans]|uniref:MFS transporter n=1 Tax=Amycolatopsis halotolerans TaxID=330083 RepID=A0ABV7QGI8_9PSEU